MLGALSGATTNFPVDMFETTSHQFGTVVKGSKTEFDFVFTNRYMEDVVIESVTSSCQCTTPSFAPRGPIKTHQQGRIHISVNTQNFVGNKNATITVRFSRPYRVEMQLHSYVYIRNDVSVNPGIVYFGSVDPTTNPAVRVNVNSINHGWRILDVQSECKFLAVELKNYHQSPNYTMTVRLRPNAPPGPFSEVLELVTNDNSRIPVRVEGRVKQTLSASPSPLSFNIIEEGQTVEKTIVVQGAEPFSIRDITSENRNISASIDRNPKKVQRIKLGYTGNQIGDFNDSITIYTDLEGGLSTSVNFNGKVIPAQKPAPAPEAEEEPEVVTETPEITTPTETIAPETVKPAEEVKPEEIKSEETKTPVAPTIPESTEGEALNLDILDNAPETEEVPEITIPTEDEVTDAAEVESLDLLDLPKTADEEPTEVEPAETEPMEVEPTETATPEKPATKEVQSLQDLVNESTPNAETYPLPAPSETKETAKPAEVKEAKEPETPEEPAVELPTELLEETPAETPAEPVIEEAIELPETESEELPEVLPESEAIELPEETPTEEIPTEQPVEKAPEKPVEQPAETEKEADSITPEADAVEESLDNLIPETVPEATSVAPTASLDVPTPAVIGRNLLRKN